MWFAVLAVLSTVILFWQKVTFPKESDNYKRSYSIIIPARNEENNLKRLLPSLLSADSPGREIIVVDDHSEDLTMKTAEAYGVKVISNPPLPEGWMGKSWACYNGAKQANGKALFFVDADTWFSPGGDLSIINELYKKGKGALITVHPYHYMNSFWEKLSAVFHLVVFASSGITAMIRKKEGFQGGFGPCLAIHTETYWKLDGHRSISDEIVEHLAFTKHAQSRGMLTSAFSGRNAVNMRMYEADLKAVINGWSKSFASGAKTASLGMTGVNIVWITLVLSFLINIESTGWWGFVGYGLLALWLYRTWKQIGNFRWYDGLLFPLYFFFFVLVFIYSLLKTFFIKETMWKGRQIVRKRRESS
ncbi:glycosyltransferase [Halobacillus litoralis]|uniref:glycosyltransferase n=1 Tax=Halobacillus litoralis TaxID=45668 RepID=UPI001CFE48B5|nr:glycosyltransferase family 2 protein [Halobacillus litoralis]